MEHAKKFGITVAAVLVALAIHQMFIAPHLAPKKSMPAGK